jgi:serine/threonine-protein kinase RsbW
MAKDVIQLTVPARTEYAKAVRMTASALVSRMGMTYDEVDDVRMAAEEAFVYAADTLAPGTEVAFGFEIDDDLLEIDVTLGAEEDSTKSETQFEQRTSYALFILESVCDSYDFYTDASGVRHLKIVKRARSGDDA